MRRLMRDKGSERSVAEAFGKPQSSPYVYRAVV